MRVPSKLLNLALRLTERRYLAHAQSVPEARDRFERRARMFFATQPGAWEREETIGGRPALRVLAGSPATDRVILYIHGGAYCLGSPRTHSRLAAVLSAKTGVPVILPEYRLAPEHHFPDAVDDVLAAYTDLMDRGFRPDQIALSGDSAGGGLALALLHLIGKRGLGQPCGTFLMCPLTDMTFSGDSFRQNADTEVLLPIERVDEVTGWYMNDADKTDPLASPLHGDFTGAGPILLQASLSEALLDDTLRLANRLTEQGVEAEVMTWDGMPHTWQLFHGHLGAADEALDAGADFLRRAFARSGGPSAS